MREGTKVGRTVGVVTAIEEELVNSRAPDIAIYFCTYLCVALAFIFFWKQQQQHPNV